MTKKKLFVIIMIPILALTGCVGVYTPPNSSTERTAVIQEYKNQGESIDIKYINGLSPRSLMGELKAGITTPLGTDSIIIHTGECLLNVEYSDGLSYAEGELKFSAQPNTTYQIRHIRFSVGKWHNKSSNIIFFIVDQGTKQPVNEMPDDLKKEILKYISGEKLPS